jgi:hypothetical protein
MSKTFKGWKCNSDGGGECIQNSSRKASWKVKSRRIKKEIGGDIKINLKDIHTEGV